MTHSASGTVVRFKHPHRTAPPARGQKDLLDAVYTAGTIPVAADDLETKQIAARLHLFGFFHVAEVGADGTARRMLPSETARTTLTRPWRLSRPGFSGTLGADEPALGRDPLPVSLPRSA